MSYEITITRTELKEVASGGDWAVVDEELAMPEGVPLSADDVGNLRLKKVYGYTPKIVKSEIVVTEIYRQSIRELDLPAVIKAVNKLD